MPHRTEVLDNDELLRLTYGRPYANELLCGREEFSVALLQPCKQIDAEAAPLFYSKNCFSCEDEIVCVRFLIQFQSRIPLLRHICLNRGSVYRRQNSKTFKHNIVAMFDLLRRAVNLEIFEVDDVFWIMLSARPVTAANALWHAAASWMQDFNSRHNNKLAILDIMTLPAHQPYQTYQWAEGTERQRQFQNQLEKRMTVKKPKGKKRTLGAIDYCVVTYSWIASKDNDMIANCLMSINSVRRQD